MPSKKVLYEAVQVERERNKILSEMIYGSTTGKSDFGHNINPNILKSAAYNQVLKTADAISASTRYIVNIPELHLPSNRLLYLMYHMGSLGFYRKSNEVKVCTYAKTGSLNGLGDLTEVYPIDFAGKRHEMKRTVVYTNKLVSNPIVIINDYTGAWTETSIISRSALNDVSINDQAEVYRQLKNSIKLTAKKACAVIQNESQRATAERTLEKILENDSPVFSIVLSDLRDAFKLFNIDTKLDIEGYMRAIESYERMRDNFNGIPTRNPIEKKERLITSEQQNADVKTKLFLYDGLVNWQVGIELMKQHAIIKEGSVKLNPILDELINPKKEECENEKKSAKAEK